MTRQPDFSGARIKVERAKKHIRDVEASIEGFLKTNPYKLVTHNEPQTGDKVFRVKVLAQPPPWWGAIVGDAIHNLRSPLDLLVCEMVRAEGKPVTEYAGFPIFKSADAFKSGYLAKVKGAPEVAVDLIKAAKPYKGGNDAFWRLHRLDIIDKHRLLIPVGNALRHVGPGHRVDFGDFFPGWEGLVEMMMPAIGPPPERAFLEDGAELYRVPRAHRGTEMDVDPAIRFEIAFGESEVVEGEPLLPALHQLAQFVEDFVKLFPPLFNQDKSP